MTQKNNSIHFSFVQLSITIGIILLATIQPLPAQESVSEDSLTIQNYLSALNKISNTDATDIKPGFVYSVYQNFISSNDSQNCPFTPSCSAYASQAIKKHGLILGTLKTGDRLQRCNGGPTLLTEYPIDFRSNRLADPVD